MARTATATRERAPEQTAAGPAPSGNLPAAQDNRQKHPAVAFKEYMDQRMGELALALPPHMTAERFGRVVLTAIQRTPSLLKCTKQSLWNACMLAAQDGLLPDGREGAIVPYADGKADQAQWMPMIEGLRKKARNSGDISNWEVHIVRARDHFEVVLGDQPRIDHKPYFGAEEPGEIIGAYSIAWLKDGTISRDVMTIRDIQKIKNISKAKNGPWSNATFFPEMAKKTVARRHYKQLPHASEMDEFIKRLDEREGLSDEAIQIEGRAQQRIGSTATAFDTFAQAGQTIDHDAGTIDHDAGDQTSGEADLGGHDPETGEVRDTARQPDQTKPKDDPKAAQQPKEADAPKQDSQKQPAADISKGDDVHRGDAGESLEDGADDELTQVADKPDEEQLWDLEKTPTNLSEYQRYVTAYLASKTTGADRAVIAGWWKSPEQRSLRNKCGVTQEAFEPLKLQAANKINSLPPAPKA